MGRVIPGGLMAAGCVSLLLWGSTNFFRFILLLVGIGSLVEYFKMTSETLSKGLLTLTVLSSLLPLLAVFSGSAQGVFAGLIISFLITLIMVLKNYDRLPEPFTYITVTCFGALYVSGGLAHLALIQSMDFGYAWLLILLAITAGSDSGAYYIGKKFGKTKLFPKVSPKKTVAGGVGGLLCGMLTALLMSLFFPVPEKLWLLLPAAALLVFMGIIGDLTESVIKRAFTIKDSGTILGGHGGLLDRIDSLLIAGPVLFYLLTWGILM